MNKKFEIFGKALENVIYQANEELINIKNNNSVWTKELVIDIIIPEVEKLLKHANDGEVYFEFGKKQRQLVCTYYVLENSPFPKSVLADKILILQKIYNKI